MSRASHLLSIFVALAVHAIAQSADLPDVDNEPERESVVIAHSGGLARRQGAMLALKLDGGRSLSLYDRDACDGPANCDIFVYRGTLADKQFFHLEERFYETTDTLLISRRSGKVARADGEPYVSPDLRHVVAASDSELGPPSGIVLWEIRQGELVQRFRYIPKTLGLFRFLRWIGSSEAELMEVAEARKSLCPNSATMQFPVRLKRVGSRWILDERVVKDRVLCDEHA